MLQNLRPMEIILIVGILLLLFGAKKLPQLAKGIGESLKIFKKEIHDVAGESEPAPEPPRSAVPVEAHTAGTEERPAARQADPHAS